MNVEAVTLTVIAVLLGGAADRIIGKGTLGHVTIGLALAALLTGWAAATGVMVPWALLVFFLTWMLWRVWCGWHILGGSINPAPGRAQYTFLRHSLTQGFTGAAVLAHLHWAPVALAMAGFAAAATVLAVINYFTLAKANGTVEILRGCCLGGALAAGFVWLQ